MAQDMIDIEFQIRRFLRRNRGRLIFVAILVVVLSQVGTVLYSIDADSQGVVLRLGAYSRTTPPGLHSKLPWPFETVYEVPVERIQSLEFGFHTARAARVTQYARASEEDKIMARMLTGDLNLCHVEWIVQFRIDEPYHYLFKIADPYARRAEIAVPDLIHDVSESVMRMLVGDASVDEVITIGRDQIASQAKVEIQELLNGFEAGVKVVAVKLQAATPPEAVKDAFDAVNRARQNKERVVNEARGERNRQIPAARGRKDRTISEAEGYRERVVRTMTGQANAFLAKLAEFEKAPEITRTRLYLEAMEDILAQVDRKIVIDESVRGLLPLLNVDAAGPIQSGRKGGDR